MEFRITTLVENCVYGKGLCAEHGLSLHIQAGERKVLLDTGASDLFVRNARILGIDLTTIDYLVLSHGHNDHTGGLRYFMNANKKAEIICKKEIFQHKYKNEIENGIAHPENLDLSRFHPIEEISEIVPGLFVCPQLKITDKKDTHFENFFTKVDNHIIADTFEDELAIALKNGKNLSILSSCSHRGITNIIQSVQEAFPKSTLKLVLGGFHIHTAVDEKFEIISTFLGINLPKRLGVCHCTGVDKYALFQQQFKDRVFYNFTGHEEVV